MTHKAWMYGSPCVYFFAAMRTDMIAHEMNRFKVWLHLCIQLLKKCAELLLPLAWVAWPKDLA